MMKNGTHINLHSSFNLVYWVNDIIPSSKKTATKDPLFTGAVNNKQPVTLQDCYVLVDQSCEREDDNPRTWMYNFVNKECQNGVLKLLVIIRDEHGNFVHDTSFLSKRIR